MYRKFTLQRLSKGAPSIVFEWDEKTGEIRGQDADQVRTWCDAAKESGGVVGDPLPTFHKVKDPLRSAGELAVVLGQVCVLSAELQRAYPQVPHETPDDLPPGTIFTY